MRTLIALAASAAARRGSGVAVVGVGGALARARAPRPKHAGTPTGGGGGGPGGRGAKGGRGALSTWRVPVSTLRSRRGTAGARKLATTIHRARHTAPLTHLTHSLGLSLSLSTHYAPTR